jgi:hypothetical protein
MNFYGDVRRMSDRARPKKTLEDFKYGTSTRNLVCLDTEMTREKRDRKSYDIHDISETVITIFGHHDQTDKCNSTLKNPFSKTVFLSIISSTF